MTFFIMHKKEKKENLMFSSNILGEESFKVFYPSLGFNMLHKIINTKPELLESISIKDEKNKSYTITEFLDLFNKWRIKKA